MKRVLDDEAGTAMQVMARRFQNIHGVEWIGYEPTVPPDTEP